MYDLSNAYFTDPVLIDTWWNVNVFNTIEDTGLYVF